MEFFECGYFAYNATQHDQKSGEKFPRGRNGLIARRSALPFFAAHANRGTTTLLTQTVERVAAVPGEWAHLAGPAAQFDGLRPLRAGEHMRPVDLVERAMARALVR